MVRPATAPVEMILDAQPAPLASNASANGAAVFMRLSLYFSIPVMTNDTAT